VFLRRVQIAGPPPRLTAIDNNRYTPDPQRSHADIIRTRPTPTRPPVSVKGRIVVAVYNYEARDSSDVSFKKGDRMEVVDDSEGDWLNVIHLMTKVQGYIPGNFVAAELSVESEELVPVVAYLICGQFFSCFATAIGSRLVLIGRLFAAGSSRTCPGRKPRSSSWPRRIPEGPS
jgi:hypothetical protein